MTIRELAIETVRRKFLIELLKDQKKYLEEGLKREKVQVNTGLATYNSKNRELDRIIV